jgi:hypothetical protein
MDQAIIKMLAAPLCAVGFLNILYLFVDFPHIFIWLGQVSYLIAIIYVNIRFGQEL